MTPRVPLLLLALTALTGVAHAQPAATAPRLVSQQGHARGLTAVALDPAGRYVVTGSEDATAVLWDAATAREVRRLDASAGWVTDVAVSPDGATVATAHLFGAVLLWDAATGVEARRLAIEGAAATAVAFDPGGGRLATAHADTSGRAEHVAQVWDVRTGRRLVTLRGHTYPVRAVAFSPDGTRLLTGSGDGTVRLWDAAAGDEQGRLEHYHDWGQRPSEWHGEWESRALTGVKAAAWSPDGTGIVAGTAAGDVVLWDAATGEERWRRVAGNPFFGEGYATEVTAVAFSPDGRYVAVATEEGGALVLEAATGAQADRLTHFTRRDGVQSAPLADVAFAPDGARLATASADRTARLWEPSGRPGTWRGGATLEGEQQPVLALAVTADGTGFFASDATGATRRWSLTTGGEDARYPDPDLEDVVTENGELHAATSVALSPDGRFVAVGLAAKNYDPLGYNPYEDGSGASVYDVVSGRWRAGFAHEEGGYEGYGYDEEGFKTHPILAVAFRPDGRALLTGGWDSRALLWAWDPEAPAALEDAYEERRPEPLRVLEHGLLNPIHAVTFSPDGARIATGASDGAVRLWDAATGALVHTLEGHTEAVHAVTFSPDGRRLLSAGWDGAVRLRDAATGAPLRVLRHEGDAGSETVEGAAFAPDGRRVLTAARDGLVRLWDAETGALLRRLAGHVGAVSAVAFLPDGRHALSGGRDGTIRLWDLERGGTVATLAALGADAWVVVDGTGRFDSNDLDEISGLHWVLPGDPFRPVPLEAFMRDFYEPRLLPRLLAGEPFPSVEGLSDRDLRLPAVAISEVAPDGQGGLRVTVEVESAAAVHDLRLFRDGRLVGVREGAIPLEGGRAAATFAPVQPPVRRGYATDAAVTFSAYAFNADGVKSPTARATRPLREAGVAYRPRAFVVSLGVNAFSDPAWDLRFAANDARLVQTALVARLRESGQFEEVVAVPLIADGQGNGATKAAFRAALARLAGEDAQGLDGIAGAEGLRRARPGDLVLITAATHGYAGEDGTFYLLPSDIGAGGGRAITPELLARAISSEELSAWLRGVDADLALIVDACHSAAAVEGGGFKPGPLGSRGLGQLAYDKRMYVLAASQTDDVALESHALRQGLLTYALVRDGLEDGAADARPADGVVTLDEWLRYGARRVPALWEAIRNGDVVPAGGRSEVLGAAAEAPAQTPALFDFSRRRSAWAVGYTGGE